jgi:NAD(P)-dependent dehydrogenase (short-subunit alcohol dehydrogenase family)
MNNSFKGRVAVVTGAGSGIGRSLARLLAQRGCHLALCDITPDRLAESARDARALGVKVSEHLLDVSDAVAVAALPAAVQAEHGGTALLFNNAGVALMGEFRQLTDADFQWLFGINFWGVVNMTRAFLPLLLAEPAAHVVNVSSVFGFVAPPGQTAYAASKFAVRGFTDALRHELEATSVRVVAVHPGGIKTNIAHSARRAAGVEASFQKVAADAFVQSVPTTPDQAAERILSGLERGELRIRIGADARMLDWISRLRPVGYWAWLKQRARKAGLDRAKAAPQ